MIRKSLLIFTAGLCTVLSSTAKADSDGAYCIGLNYIAFEKYSEDGRNLHIAKTDAQHGVSLKAYIIPENQSWWRLNCEEAEVILNAYDSALKFDLTSQNFSKTAPLETRTVQKRWGGPHPQGGTSEVLSLKDWSSDGSDYQLHTLTYIYPETGNIDGLIEHHTVARIVRLEKDSRNLKASHDLYSKVFIETVD